MGQYDWSRTVAQALVPQMHLHAEKRDEHGWRRSPPRGERRERSVWRPVQRDHAAKRDRDDDQDDQDDRHAGDHTQLAD